MAAEDIQSPARYKDWRKIIVEGDQPARITAANNERLHITFKDFRSHCMISGASYVAFTGQAKSEQDAQSTGSRRAICRIADCGVVEGYQFSFNAGLGRGLDALIIGNGPNDPRFPNVRLEDFELTGGWNEWPLDKVKDRLHGDAIHLGYGKVGHAVLRRGQVFANHQGGFFDPQDPIKSLMLQNIDFRYGAKPKGYTLFLNNGNLPQPPTYLHNVRVFPRSTGLAEMYSVAPARHWKGGCVRSGDIITFPNQPEIVGHIKVMP